MCISLDSWAGHAYVFASILLILIWERWLGRTAKTKAASTIDLVVNLSKHLFGIKTKPQLLLTGHTTDESKEIGMLEGREFEKKLGANGEYGTVFADVKEDLMIEIGYSGDLAGLLKGVAAKTQKPWLRGAINFAMGFFQAPKETLVSSQAEAPKPAAPATQPATPATPAKDPSSVAVSNDAIKSESPGERKMGETL